jgi:excisionase family DNA binding protein
MIQQVLPTPKQLISRKEAAQRIGVSLITIDRALANNRLTRYRSTNGFHIRLDAQEVDALSNWIPDTEPARIAEY